jgi:4-amino-4-deoxy-L-arabinose transferase-like glycosyltransferase
MTPNAPMPVPEGKRELLVVIAFTLIGGVLRLWSPGRLGLVHFDEGIYALAGLWIASPQGLLGFDPTIIAYAPPAFPLLVGLSYSILGVGDLSAILVAIVSGTLTVPVAAWLAHRSFGYGAGSAAAAFTALSGPHITFSRMALTDAPFLLFWLLAIGQGQRFLERPNPARAVALGLAVGLAQLFKYNGWIAGAVVAVTAALWLARHHGQYGLKGVAATWGWGCAAALVAAVVYWPWFQFVESHGGYAALLAHHRSYLGGRATWPGHLSLQLGQAKALSGGPVWLGSSGLAAILGIAIVGGEHGFERRFAARLLVMLFCLAALCVLPHTAFWLSLIGASTIIALGGGAGAKAAWVLGVCWWILAILTPFYHPYARLWLPVEALGWLFLAAAFVAVRANVRGAGQRGLGRFDLLPWLAAGCVLSGGLLYITGSSWSNARLQSVLESSDSVRTACQALLTKLPKDVHELRALVRPPVVFYLGMTDRVAISRQAGLEGFLEQGPSSTWAVLDTAMSRQSGVSPEELERYLARWKVVDEFPTWLTLPVLLDIDPAAANQHNRDPAADLDLLRPRGPGDVR